MTAQLLDLPPELLTHILSSLALRDLLCATSACKTLHALLQLLQYRLALLSSGHINNPSNTCPLVLSERLAALRTREAAWRAANVKRMVHIATPQGSQTGIYDLTGGLCFIGLSSSGSIGETTREMRWLRLPGAGEANAEEKPVWARIDVGEDIIGIGLNVHELDLVAIVTSKPVPLAAEPLRTIYIHLLQLSTGHPHPAAQMSILPIVTVPLRAGPSDVTLKIAGPALLFLASFPSPDALGAHSDDRLWAVDWRTGAKHAFRTAPSGSYAGLVLLAHDACMLPNIIDGTLELFRLPSSLCAPPQTDERERKEDVDGEWPAPTTAPPQDDDNALPMLAAMRVLALPELASGCEIANANCYSEPGPVGRGGVYHVPYARDARPFAEDPAEAIVLVTLEISDRVAEAWGAGPGYFELVVHRSVLLGMLAPLEEEKEEEEVQRGVSLGHNTGAAADANIEDIHLENDTEQLREGTTERNADEEVDDRELTDLEDLPFFPGSFGAPSSSAVVPIPHSPTSSLGRPSPSSSSDVSLRSMRATGSLGFSPLRSRSHSPSSGASLHSTHSPVSSMPSLSTASFSSGSSLPEVAAPLPWSAWGPPVTRWLELDEAQSWITRTSGQRLAVMQEGERGARRRLRILDFGRWRAVKGLASLRRARADEGANTHAKETQVGPNYPKKELAGLATADASKHVSGPEGPIDMHGRSEEVMEVTDEHVVGAWHDADEWVHDDELGSEGTTDIDDADIDSVPVDANDAPLPGGAVLLDPSTPDVRFVAGPSVLDMSNFFAYEVCSSLPYFEVRSAERYTYERVLMDEERVVGLITSIEGTLIALDVIRFE